MLRLAVLGGKHRRQECALPFGALGIAQLLGPGFEGHGAAFASN
jgi:hypothetical protein